MKNHLSNIITVREFFNLKIGDIVYIELYDNYKNLIVDNKNPKIITNIGIDDKFQTVFFAGEGYDLSIKKNEILDLYIENYSEFDDWSFTIFKNDPNEELEEVETKIVNYENEVIKF